MTHQPALHRPPYLNRRHIVAGLGAGALALLVPRRAAAVLKLDVTQGNVQPLPVAIPDFVGVSPTDVETSRNVSRIISANLQRSGLFAPIDPVAGARATACTAFHNPTGATPNSVAEDICLRASAFHPTALGHAAIDALVGAALTSRGLLRPAP